VAAGLERAGELAPNSATADHDDVHIGLPSCCRSPMLRRGS
jgi:hypothetical protein